MAAIEIPDEYWTIEPRGFAALAAPFKDALDGIRADVLNGAAGFATGLNDDVTAAVGGVDADADTIAADAQTVHTGLATADTGGVLQQFTPADALTSTADQSQPPPEPPAHQSIFIPPLPPPPDNAPAPGNGLTAAGDLEPVTDGGDNAPATARLAPVVAAPLVPIDEPTPPPPADVAPADAVPTVAPLDLAPPPPTAGDDLAAVDPSSLPVTRGELAQILDTLNATIVVMV